MARFVFLWKVFIFFFFFLWTVYTITSIRLPRKLSKHFFGTRLTLFLTCQPVHITIDSRSRTMQKITPFLWFNDQAEEAMNFYVSIFKNSKITMLRRYGKEGPGPEGSVMTGT